MKPFFISIDRGGSQFKGCLQSSMDRSAVGTYIWSHLCVFDYAQEQCCITLIVKGTSH